MTKINRQWRLRSRPVGKIQESDFEWREEPVPALEEGQLLIRNLYISLDPANRGWISERGSYMEPVKVNDVMPAIALGRVEESQHPKFPQGALVQGMIGWQDYLVSNGKGFQVLQPIPGIPLTAYLGLFGHIGLTAYFGLLDIGRPKAGETLVVNAAAGAVGSLVGQIGKIKGCRVVGIAGSDEKCRWITEELGFDAAINYKTEPVYEKLKEHCPGGIDVIFENVGGKIFDAELALINLHARIALCGLISQYNATEPVPGPYNFPNILTRRARVEGFIVIDYLPRAMEAIIEMGQWYAEGKLQYRVDIVEGLEYAPQAVNKLFEGTNEGKLLVKVTD